jgi:OmpA-OmpF porin, OOP family
MTGRTRNGLKVVGPVVAIAVGLGFAGNAPAQGPYLGGGVGATDIDIGIWGNAANQSTTYTLFFGYELPKYVGVEAAWVDLGGHENTLVGNAGGTLHTNGWTAAVTGRIPIVNWFSLYGKVGTFFWSTRFDVDWSWGDPTNAGNGNGHDLFWAAGLRFNSGKVSFLGEYERYMTGGLDDHKAFGFAVRYTF